MKKPSWRDAPDFAQWLAMDADGMWWWFSKKPHWSRNGRWAMRGSSGVSQVAIPGPDASKRSLEQRKKS